MKNEKRIARQREYRKRLLAERKARFTEIAGINNEPTQAFPTRAELQKAIMRKRRAAAKERARAQQAKQETVKGPDLMVGTTLPKREQDLRKLRMRQMRQRIETDPDSYERDPLTAIQGYGRQLVELTSQPVSSGLVRGTPEWHDRINHISEMIVILSRLGRRRAL